MTFDQLLEDILGVVGRLAHSDVRTRVQAVILAYETGLGELRPRRIP